jgi:rSAM/selenodomain-associated transferase 2
MVVAATHDFSHARSEWRQYSIIPIDARATLRISVIIPALNEALNIVHAVERAAALGPHEILVADGGSDDGTPQAARQAGAVVVESARGRARQQNAAARQATGDVLLFLHADSWLAPAGATQLSHAWRDPRVLGGAFRHRIEAAGILYRLIERGDSFRARWFQLPYGDQGIFLRREAFFQLGGFPDVPLMEDVLLMRRLRKASRVVLLPGPVYTSARRWERHGVVRQTLRNWSILTAERLGVSLDRLARFYAPHADSVSKNQISAPKGGRNTNPSRTE